MRRFLGFCLCTGSDTAQAYKFIKYFIDSPCSEDDLELGIEKIQKLTDKMIEQIDKAVEAKSKEILTV